jgi:hypothetical protein
VKADRPPPRLEDALDFINKRLWRLRAIIDIF